jgi:hypothetical protein
MEHVQPMSIFRSAGGRIPKLAGVTIFPVLMVPVYRERFGNPFGLHCGIVTGRRVGDDGVQPRLFFGTETPKHGTVPGDVLGRQIGVIGVRQAERERRSAQEQERASCGRKYRIAHGLGSFP